MEESLPCQCRYDVIVETDVFDGVPGRLCQSPEQRSAPLARGTVERSLPGDRDGDRDPA